ncbi:hypothetical protein DD509_03890 [Dehalogenimonas alkenigignens]|nr:hypothetical protein DD509_03890 [Dehalogenimonas alkenigignens]
MPPLARGHFTCGHGLPDAAAFTPRTGGSLALLGFGLRLSHMPIGIVNPTALEALLVSPVFIGVFVNIAVMATRAAFYSIQFSYLRCLMQF